MIVIPKGKFFLVPGLYYTPGMYDAADFAGGFCNTYCSTPRGQAILIRTVFVRLAYKTILEPYEIV